MAIQIFPERSSIGELFGTGIGSGLSQGLQTLAQQKLAQFAQRQQRSQTQQALESLGLPAQTAAGIGGLPQNLQVEYIKNMRRQQQQQALSQALGGLVPGTPGVAPAEGVAVEPGAQTGMPQTAQQRGVGDVFGGGEIPVQQQMQLQQLAQRERLTEQKMTQQKELAAAKMSAREQVQSDKETFKSYEKYSIAAEDASNKIPLVEEFIRISREGDPGTPAANTMRDLVGLAIGKDAQKDWLYTDDATIQKKLSAQLVKLTLEKMQGRKSVEVLKAIRRTFPNIYQNKGAQEAISKTLLYEYKMNDLKNILSDKIIEENGGRRPRNYNSLVQKLSKKFEPRLAEKYLPRLGAYKKKGGVI